VQTVSGQLGLPGKIQTTSGKSTGQKGQTVSGELAVRDLCARFPLPWSAYVRLLSVKDEQARKFYEIEALARRRAIVEIRNGNAYDESPIGF